MMASDGGPPVKRYRREEDTSGSEDFYKEGDDYVPYVPVKERRKQKLVKLGRVAGLSFLAFYAVFVALALGDASI